MTEKRHYKKLALLLLIVPLVCMKVMWLKKMKMSESKGEHMGYCMHGNRMGHCPECKKMKMSESEGEHMGYCMHGNRMGHCPECKKVKTEENSSS